MTKSSPRTPASAKIGVREIAKRVGVSPITVSRALSKPDMVSAETRAKVFNAIDQTGFVPSQLASSMRGNGRMIGTVVPPLINSGIAEQVAYALNTKFVTLPRYLGTTRLPETSWPPFTSQIPSFGSIDDVP